MAEKRTAGETAEETIEAPQDTPVIDGEEPALLFTNEKGEIQGYLFRKGLKPYGLIYQKIPEVMAAVGAIGKDKKNAVQGYKFRGIDDVYNALNPVMAAAKVFATSEIIERIRDERTTKAGGVNFYTTLRMKFRFHAEDGSFVESVTEGEAMDSGDKSTNKAMSVAYKYALMQIFCIPTEDEKDTENNSPEVLPKTSPAPVAKPAAPATTFSRPTPETVKKEEPKPAVNEEAPKVNESGAAGAEPVKPVAAAPTIITSEQNQNILNLLGQLGYSAEKIPERIASLEERYGKTMAEFTEGEARDIIKKMEAQVATKKAADLQNAQDTSNS